VTQDKSIN